MISEVTQVPTGPLVPQVSSGAGAGGPVDGPAPAADESDAGKPETAGLNEQTLEGLVGHLNEFAQTVQRQLQFSVDDDSGKTVIKVIDAETDEVIRQIPPKDVLEMQQRMQEVNGLLFDSKA